MQPQFRNRHEMTPTRREAVKQFWMLLAASPLLRAQESLKPVTPAHVPERIPPVDELINAFEYEDVARKMLPKPVYDHIAAGAGSERTLQANRDFFDRITFRPRMLVNVSEMDLSTRLFGQEMFAPILVGPTSNHRRMHPEAETATAEGATAAKATMIVSGRSSVPIEEIAAQTESLWFQTDFQQDAGATQEAVKGAVGAGCKAVFLTVGAPYKPALARDIHNRYWAAPKEAEPLLDAAGRTKPVWPPDPKQLALQASPKLDWDLIDQVKESADVPVILKGIMSPDEASQAVSNGVDGIVVSNHGGRAVDGVPSTIETLPRIAEVVQGRVPLLVDGGFRRGTDILKGLALGADAVLLGRPVLWALAGYGALGVQKLLEMLQMELALAMGLSGKPNLKAIDRSLVKIHRW